MNRPLYADPLYVEFVEYTVVKKRLKDIIVKQQQSFTRIVRLFFDVNMSSYVFEAYTYGLLMSL